MKKDSFGWGDPRSLKTHLEGEGFTTWIDYEQIGTKKTLFEDIVDGIRNSKAIIACVSNEYAQSENCMKEFRFASNLKIPIIICTFGSPNVKCVWRNTELGIISCLITKEINFQLENKNAYQDLVNEIKFTHQIEPIKKVKINIDNEFLTNENENKDTRVSYFELFELAQRKFLRHISTFADTRSNSRPFPRLVVVDLNSSLFDINLIKNDTFKKPINRSSLNKIDFFNKIASNISSPSSRKSNLYDDSPSYSSNNSPKLCLKILCEHEKGWHPSGSSIDYEFQSRIPFAHFAYLIRIMSLIKHSNLDLDIIQNITKLDEFINYIDEKLPSQQQSQQPNSSQQSQQDSLYTFSYLSSMSSQSSPSRFATSLSNYNADNDMIQVSSSMTQSSYPQIYDFKESYHSIKNYVINYLEKFKTFQKESEQVTNNVNRLEEFNLNRCSLPSGKILWLCDEHSKEENVQILTKNENENVLINYQNDEYNSILLEQLKKYDTQ
jgi:hypothetical protein